MKRKVYIIILNWNRYLDTIECLESVYRMQYENYQVVVCDNYSSNCSIEKIKEWSEGKLVVKSSTKEWIKKCMSSRISKKITWEEYTQEEVENCIKKRKAELILIRNSANNGFAAGNNVGIKYAIQQEDCYYIWLLNNDTVVEKSALKNLVDKMSSKRCIGICGSKLYYYQDNQVQAIGGKYNKLWGLATHIKDDAEAENIDYVVGASMLVSKEFLDTVGLMNEEYFLYYEELDWSFRAKNNFSIACELNSIVYHKEGASSGGNDNEEKSEIADFYAIRNRILFTQRYHPAYIVFVYLGLLAVIFNRVRRKQYRRVRMCIWIFMNSLLGVFKGYDEWNK